MIAACCQLATVIVLTILATSVVPALSANCSAFTCNNGGVCNTYTASPPCICPLPYIPPYCSAAANYCSTAQPDRTDSCKSDNSSMLLMPICLNNCPCTMTYTGNFFNCTETDKERKDCADSSYCVSKWSGCRCNDTKIYRYKFSGDSSPETLNGSIESCCKPTLTPVSTPPPPPCYVGASNICVLFLILVVAVVVAIILAVYFRLCYKRNQKVGSTCACTCNCQSPKCACFKKMCHHNGNSDCKNVCVCQNKKCKHGCKCTNDACHCCKHTCADSENFQCSNGRCRCQIPPNAPPKDHVDQVNHICQCNCGCKNPKCSCSGSDCMHPADCGCKEGSCVCEQIAGPTFVSLIVPEAQPEDKRELTEHEEAQK